MECERRWPSAVSNAALLELCQTTAWQVARIFVRVKASRAQSRGGEQAFPSSDPYLSSRGHEGHPMTATVRLLSWGTRFITSTQRTEPRGPSKQSICPQPLLASFSSPPDRGPSWLPQIHINGRYGLPSCRVVQVHRLALTVRLPHPAPNAKT